MRFLIFIALFSCSTLFASEEYAFIADVNKETKVYLSNGAPLFYRDTLIFDEDIMVLLGQGTFNRKLVFPTNCTFGDYMLIFEHPQKGYLTYRAALFLNKGDRVFKINLEGEPTNYMASTSLPITINLGDVLLDVLSASDGSSSFLDGQYHTGYTTPSEKSNFIYFEDYLGSQIEFVLSEFGSNEPKNEKYDVIPDLELDCTIIEKISEGLLMSKHVYDIDFQLYDSDSLLCSKTFSGNQISSFDSNNINKRYWFISRIRSFINEIDLEKLREKYSKSFNKKQKAWSTLYMSGSDKSNAVGSVITIAVENGHGSGVVISKGGYILTNYHVVKNEKKVIIITQDRDEISGQVIRFNKKYDIAIIKTTNHEFTEVAEFDRKKEREVGTAVLCIGSPLSEFLDGTISEGFISGKYQKREYEHYVVSANINPGNSGGGLFTKDGKLIGIVNAKIVGSSNHNIGFVIPIEVVKNELKISF